MSDFYSAQTMNTMIYEILGHANVLLKQDREKGIQYLQTNRSKTVIEGLLRLNYDPSVNFQIPVGEPPYKKNKDVPDGYCLTDLKQEFRRLRIFLDESLNISKIRREQLWIQMCEGLFWKEADLIHKIKDRRITDIYDELTADTVREIFPNLLPEVVAEPTKVEEIKEIDYGPDPSIIPVDVLIKQALINEGILKVEEPITPKPIIDDPEYAEFLKWKELQGKKEKAGVNKGTTTPATTQRKKPGPKPKAKVVEESTPVRKKPGPKPKPKQ